MKTKIKTRRAQLQIQEMAFVLVAIAILFVFVFLFFARLQAFQMREAAQFLREQKTIGMLRTIASLPELRCSVSGSSVSEVACVDRDKLKAFCQKIGERCNEMLNRDAAWRETWRKVWKGAKIVGVKIKEEYCETGCSEEWVLYDEEAREYEEESTYIALCQNMQNPSCIMGKIIVKFKPAK